MMRAAPRRTKCSTAAAPRPVLAPVTTMVWAVNECVGGGGAAKLWVRKEPRMKEKRLFVVPCSVNVH